MTGLFLHPRLELGIKALLMYMKQQSWHAFVNQKDYTF